MHPGHGAGTSSAVRKPPDRHRPRITSLRIALLFAQADPPETGARPALRRFAGKTVLAHQIDGAAHLGCTRILCLADDAGLSQLAALRGYAERAELQFEIVATPAEVMARVTATDELVLIADGVLPDREALMEQSASRATVFAFPAAQALPLGFERIDADHAWSGVLFARGDCIARLATLAPDCDLGSSLLRLTLQSRASVALLDPAMLLNNRWQRRADPTPDVESERKWVASQVQLAPFSAVGTAIAERLGLHFAHSRAGERWALAPHIATALALMGALAAAAWAAPGVGLVLLLVASIALVIAEVFGRVEALGSPGRRSTRRVNAAAAVRDAVLIAVLAIAAVIVPNWISALLPLVLMALLWLAAATGPAWLRHISADRVLLLAMLIPAVASGWTTAAVGTSIVTTLAALLWSAYGNRAALTAA